jgi:3-hydroxyacyl-CoA dehydrogenase
VVFCHGYGMPRYRGGPMKYGDEVGLATVVAAMEKYRKRYGDLYWTPAPLLAKLAAAGQKFTP